MKQHTKTGLLKSWSSNQAQSRASRKGSSAPTKEELAIYEKALRQAISRKKNPRVMILGATPELRDLALKYNCQALAVDISWPILCAMHEVMKYNDDPKNTVLLNDWLTVRKFLRDETFDVIMGDAALNNVPANSHSSLLRDLQALLKRGGYFVTRQVVYLPASKDETIDNFQKLYNRRQTYWLMFYTALGFKSDWKTYDPKTKRVAVGKLFKIIKQELENGNLHFRKEDMWKVENVIKHAHNLSHIVFSKADFEKMARKYFIIESVNVSKWAYTDQFPIYAMRKK